MASDEGTFWDQRYCHEGAIWGEEPSPTARLLAEYLKPGARVVDIGSGYGRDLVFLSRKGCRVSGVELSTEGHRQAASRLLHQGCEAERLVTGRFEETSLPEGLYDAALSHRMIHLLVSGHSIADFAARVSQILRPGGILAVGARNLDDLDPAAMVRVMDNVYEYKDRPGHRIRYWDDEAFRQSFGKKFTVQVLEHTAELESRARPLPCHLTIMIARKRTRP